MSSLKRRRTPSGLLMALAPLMLGVSLPGLIGCGESAHESTASTSGSIHDHIPAGSKPILDHSTATGPNPTESPAKKRLDSMPEQPQPKPPAGESSIPIFEPTATLKLPERLGKFHTRDCIFLSYDGSVIARQFTDSDMDSSRCWIELTDTLDGNLRVSIDCGKQVWDGAFRPDNQQFVVRTHGIQFYSVDGNLVGEVKAFPEGQMVDIGYSMDGKLVYVFNEEELALIDAEKFQLIKTIPFQTETAGQSRQQRVKKPCRLPGSDKLMLATDAGEIYHWTIGPGPIEKLGKLQVNQEEELIEVWPVANHDDRVIARREWGKIELRGIAQGKRVGSVTLPEDGTVSLGTGRSIGYLNQNYFLDCEGYIQQDKGPLVVRVTQDEMIPVALLNLPSTPPSHSRFLLSGDGSTFVTEVQFKTASIYKMAEVISAVDK